MTSVFLTGFPGFLGSELIERLLTRYSQDVRINCLIQARFRELAERRVTALGLQEPGWKDRVCLVEGDITAPDLGLGGDYDGLAQETFEIYHLAAAYDLAVPRELGMRINVDGTRNMLAFAQKCGGALRRFQYVSTCYVSGRHKGTFTEHDLVCGQVFNNYYEETKYLAEVDVQQQMRQGLPATIYRPAVVVGDSRTGSTQKYDGPYYLIQWMLRYPKLALIPVIGDTVWHEVNLVPRDFVIDALDYLSSREDSEGKVYQLCDPHPLTVDLIIKRLERETSAHVVRVPAPLGLTKRALKLGPVYSWTRIEAETIDYFMHPTHYTCDNVLHDLAGSGIACPPLTEYLGNLIRFMRAHPEVSPHAMI
ncbi:MAG: SDR family oxidoreductase [Nitrososphaerales archaeon]